MIASGNRTEIPAAPQQEGQPVSPLRLGRILVCEDYPGMKDVFDLMLGGQYELAFVESPEEIVAFLAQSLARLLIWDLNRGGDYLGTLRRIRRICPALKILLVGGEFDVEFQLEVIRECGLASFLTKPWGSSAAVAERIQVMLGDRKSSIHQRILRIPLTR